MPKKKVLPKRLKEGAIPYVFMIVGFFGSALTTELMNIFHQFAKESGKNWFTLHTMIVMTAWVLCMYGITKMIDNLYEEK